MRIRLTTNPGASPQRIGVLRIVWAKVTGRGSASGVPVETEHGQIWTLRDGKVIRVVEYFDRAEALKAVGLEE